MRSISTLFIGVLLFASQLAQAQRPPVDCPDKKKICKLTDVLNDNGNGIGTQELNSANQGCLSSGEKAATWYYFTAATGGTINFTINPDNPNDDYDFAIWGPNPPCPPTGAPIRCSYCVPLTANQTGINASSLDNSELPAGCDQFVKQITVVAGETYIIYIDNYSTSSSGFHISFGGTATLDCNGVVFPVAQDLLAFTAKRNKPGQVALNWKMATEHNIQNYILERKKGNGAFETIASLQSTKGSNYSYTDKCDYKGTVYYRFKQISYNNDEKVSKVLLVDLLEAADKLEGGIYPNPALAGENKISFSYSSAQEQMLNISVFNYEGTQVLSVAKTIKEGANTIDVPFNATLPAGVYLLKLQSENYSEVQRFIVK